MKNGGKQTLCEKALRSPVGAAYDTDRELLKEKRRNKIKRVLKGIKRGLKEGFGRDVENPFHARKKSDKNGK